MNKYQTAFLQLSLLCLLCNISSAQTPRAKREFYNSEQQGWEEYIKNYDAFLNNSDFNILFYNINVDIRLDTEYLRGNVACRFRVEKDFIDSIQLDLHNTFSIDSITGNVSGFRLAGDSIMINLDRYYRVNEIAEINIFYKGIPALANKTKGLVYKVHGQNERIVASLSTPFLAHYWWPCKDGPGDKADSVYINITIPDTMINNIPVIAVSNGILENVLTKDGKKTFQWRHRYPIVPYYVMAAVSNYTTISETNNYNNVSFPINYYVFNEHYSTSQEGTKDLPEVIKFFSSAFGEYPFSQEKYGMTELGFYGAIENQTNTIINEMSPDWFLTSVHELSHMWFGDMITCKNWHHAWLNEGFASYCEALWAEYKGGFDAYKANMVINNYLAGGTLYLQDISDPFLIFIDIIYSKGAYLLHMLRGVLGDTVFFKCLYEYANNSQYKYAEAETDDFRMICEQVSGTNLEFFFDEWVYDEYYPIYQYSFSQNSVTKETTIYIKQTQSNLGRRKVFKMPVQLLFNFTNGKDTLVTVLNDQQQQDFTFNFNYPVKNIVFDPDNWILKKINPTVGIDAVDRDKLSHAFYINQNYPNPFNPTTNFGFRVGNFPNGTSGLVTLKIYDILGNEVTTLVNEDKEPGEYVIQFDATKLSSGIYFYKFTAGSYAKTKSMVILK